MSAKSMLIAALIASATTSVLAQSKNVINIVGTIEKVDTVSISVKSEESGAVESFKLAPNFLVLQNRTATLADIKPNDFIASAAVYGADGKLHSTELRIFPDARRGRRPTADE